jgi:hypothetical protein
MSVWSPKREKGIITAKHDRTKQLLIPANE